MRRKAGKGEDSFAIVLRRWSKGGGSGFSMEMRITLWCRCLTLQVPNNETGQYQVVVTGQGNSRTPADAVLVPQAVRSTAWCLSASAVTRRWFVIRSIFSTAESPKGEREETLSAREVPPGALEGPSGTGTGRNS